MRAHNVHAATHTRMSPTTVSSVSSGAAVATFERARSGAMAAAAVANAAVASHLPDNWILALQALLDPRAIWAPFSDKVLFLTGLCVCVCVCV